MTVLKFKLKDQKLIKDGSLPFVAAGDVNTDLIAITLDDFWLDFSSYFLTIWGDYDEEPYKVAMQKSGETLSAVIPSEILALAQTVRIAIFAEGENGKRKTSSPTKFRINAGSPVDGLTPIDWNAFKSELINELNNRFQLEFANDASNNDILSKINELVDAGTVKAFFIEILNTAANYINEQAVSSNPFDSYNAVPLTLLTEEMTDEQLAATIDANFQKMAKTTEYYLGTMEIIDRMQFELENHMEVSGDTDRDVRELAQRILDKIGGLSNQSAGIISLFPELNSTSSSDEITEAVASVVADRNDVLKGLYSLYTGGNT